MKEKKLHKYEKVEAFKYNGKIYETKEDADNAKDSDIAGRFVSKIEDLIYDNNEYSKAITVIGAMLSLGITTRKSMERTIDIIEQNSGQER